MSRILNRATAILLGLGLLVLPLPALSQGVVKAQYGDWQMSCDTPPGASFEQCAIIQNVTAEDQPNVGLSVIVLKTADRQARLLRVLAPLGVLLPNGLGLNIDGTDMGRVAFVRCLPNGCVAEVVMDDALIKQLSEGTTAIFVVFKTPEEGIGIPVSTFLMTAYSVGPSIRMSPCPRGGRRSSLRAVKNGTPARFEEGCAGPRSSAGSIISWSIFR